MIHNALSASSRRTGIRGALHSLPLVVGFALLTAVAANVRVVLPFTPVPGTLQTVVVVVAGMLAGARLGAASMLLYLALGLAGLPAFAAAAGPATLVGPTAGYLLGFVVAQPVIGMLLRGRTSALRYVVAALTGHAVILALGATWLAVLSGGGVRAALMLGVAPFAAGSILKSLAAAGVCVGLRRNTPRPWQSQRS